jgi:hypothetical protein
MTMRCLECGTEQAGDAAECAGCGAAGGARPAGPAALTLGKGRVRLRVDENGIKVKDAYVAERVIGWDEVRWLRDGMRLSRRTRWSLEIVLKDGSVLAPEAAASTTAAAVPRVLEVIRQAARDHAVPAVLTGRAVRRCGPGIPPRAGLYPDPGGEPGLREWDGAAWSPVLRTDPGGSGDLAATWSPLPRQARQRHAEAAAEEAGGWRRGAGALTVLTLALAASALVVLGIACAWLGLPGAGVSGGAKTALWLTGLFLALGTAGLQGGTRRVRRSVRRRQRIAELAGQAAAQASAQDVESPPGRTWVLSGPGDTQLRLDIHEITLRTRRQTRWIAWDDVRWFRDGEYARPLRRLRGNGWALAIVLRDGTVVSADATRQPRQPGPETMTAVRQAAADHAVPAVLTGRPVSATPSPVDKAGLYPDPGGEPGLREWTGTGWLPSLLVSPDGDGQAGPVSVVSPLPADVRQREWDAAIDAVPSRCLVAGAMFGILLAWAVFLPYPLIAIPTINRYGFWLGTSHALAAVAWAGIFLWACGLGAVMWLPVRSRRTYRKVARAARAAMARAAERDVADFQRREL